MQVGIRKSEVESVRIQPDLHKTEVICSLLLTIKILKMEQKFTPGKWYQSHREIPNDEDGMYATQVYTEDGETICTLSWYPMPPKQVVIDGKPKIQTGTYREGNAILIANAPEMLKCLEMIYNIEDGAFGLKSFNVEDLKRKIGRVIKSATGS